MALIPSTGGIFKVTIQHEALERPSSEVQAGSRGVRAVTTKMLWDRGVEGGFPGRFRSTSFWLQTCFIEGFRGYGRRFVFGALLRLVRRKRGTRCAKSSRRVDGYVDVGEGARC